MKNGTETEKKTGLLADALAGMGTKAEDIKLPEHVEPSKPWPRPEKKIDDGGPASDKTLRDYFAAKAMKLYFDQAPKSTRKAERFFISKSAYHMADAMVEAKK